MERKLTIIILLLAAALQGICADSETRTEYCGNSSDSNIEDAVLRLTIVLAEDGDFEEANTELQVLPNYASQISKVVKSVYSENVANTERTLDILHSISCTVLAKASSALFQEMRKPDNLAKPEFLLLSQLLQDPRCSGDTKIKEINTLIAPYMDKSLDRWAEDIRNGSFEHIYQFMRSHRSKAYSILPQVSILVNRTFGGNVAYFNSTVYFVKDLPDPESIFLGYRILLEKLKEMEKDYSEEMMFLSYWIHHDVTNRCADNIAESASLSTLSDQLKKKMPSTFHDIFWKSQCTIKNARRNEYLDASYDRDNEYGNPVYTRDSSFWHPEWSLKPQVIGETLSFILEMASYPSFGVLCEATDKGLVNLCDGPRNRLYNKWILRPSSRNKTVFFMQNAFHKAGNEGYLVATRMDPLNEKRRHVRDSTLQQADHWKIECHD